MSWQVDFAVATGIFLLFFSGLISYLSSLRLSSSSYLYNLEKEEINFIISNSLSGEGIPEDWDESKNLVKIGLQSKLFRVPVRVKEEGGGSGFLTFNFSFEFDPNCEKKAWNNTIRVFEGGKEIPFQLVEQNFCSEQFLKNATILLSSSFNPYEEKYFFVYFSNDREISFPSYSFQQFQEGNFSIEFLPEQKFFNTSISKLEALKSISKEEISQLIGDYEFLFEAII